MYRIPDQNADLEVLSSTIRRYEQQFQTLINDLEGAALSPASVSERIISLEKDLRRVPRAA